MQGAGRRDKNGGRVASEVGRLGEAMAARFLEEAGWALLGVRWRDGPRELDLIALRSGILAFVEVKTRRSADLDPLLLSVTPAKRRELERAAGAWLRQVGPSFPPFAAIRFDVMAVQLPPGQKPRILHIEAAWQRC
jgi:putative endonuclease